MEKQANQPIRSQYHGAIFRKEVEEEQSQLG
jgi:hypothetical protein